MRTFKQILAWLMVMALLACVPVVTSATETTAEIFDGTDGTNSVTHSVTVEDATGMGLAFRFRVNVKGVETNARNEFINTNATTVYEGEEYKVVKMGALVGNQIEDIVNFDSITLDNVDGEGLLDIPVQYLCTAPEADYCEFAVRVIKLPEQGKGRAIACRPYIVLEKMNGEPGGVLYDAGDICTYNQIYYANTPEETPALDVSGVGAVDDKIAATASAEYVAYETETYLEAFKVNLTLQNTSVNAATSVGDTVTYSFKDADGNELGSEVVALDALNPGESKDVEFYAPVAAATIEMVDSSLNYVPVITLPEIGSDIDVTKQKNRIRVSATEAYFNEDGTIHVALTFKNYTSNWITEETDYVQYTYYDAAGTKIKTETLYIGVIDTKKHPVKTYEFDLPANAASVKITKSKIVYWTEWA